MNEHKVEDFGCVSNAVVYGLEESIRRAKYPMSTDVSKLNTELTDGILMLAKSDKPFRACLTYLLKGRLFF